MCVCVCEINTESRPGHSTTPSVCVCVCVCEINTESRPGHSTRPSVCVREINTEGRPGHSTRPSVCVREINSLAICNLSYIHVQVTDQHALADSAEHCEAGPGHHLETDRSQPLHKPKHTLQRHLGRGHSIGGLNQPTTSILTRALLATSSSVLTRGLHSSHDATDTSPVFSFSSSCPYTPVPAQHPHWMKLNGNRQKIQYNEKVRHRLY